ncbi:hypothetical protein [Dinghuibacter silviterrae]|uniref:Uncharacterized protein n=1 Tax=Dinghuibacter silviterrae TaxID=1539049 RepID=A0A4R8DNH6_9BACT|nr:hypothetical protein [Dinghuibacter silviterrae]TDW99581.1 hypothetical protein EDB95_0591 [Dinghuibacter silviterrae]
MRFPILLTFLLTLHLATHAQISGVIALKRHNVTVQRYYANRSSFTFINQDGQRITGVVAGGAKDTIYLRFYDVRQGVNMLGLPTWDTLTNYPVPFAISEIKEVVRDRTSLNYAADGSILIAAGVGLQVLEVVNGAYMHQDAKDWLTGGSFLTSVGLAGLGAWLITLQTKHYRIGKKYHLEYYGFSAPPAKG